MNDLRETIRAEFIKFADSIHDIVMRTISERMFGGSMPKQAAAEEPPRRARVTQENKEEVLATIIELLGRHPEGLRSEQIRRELKLDKKAFQLAMNVGKESDQIVQSGERRATVYNLPKAGARAQAEGRVIKGKKKSAR